MNLKIKLGLLFGSLTLLLIVSTSMSYLLVKRIDNDVQNLRLVEEPLVEAVFTMEISIGKGSESIIQYSIDRDKKHIQRFQETNVAFAAALQEYDLLAKSDEEQEAGRRIRQIQVEFEELSNDIVTVTDGIKSGLTKLGADITDIEVSLMDEIAFRTDPNTLEGLSKIEAVLTLSIDIDEAFLAVQSYVANPDPVVRRTLREKRAELGDTEEIGAVLDTSNLSIEQEDLIGAFDAVFLGVVTAGESIMDQVDDQRVLLVLLENDLENIDRIIGEEIQPLLFAQTARRLIDAEASVDVAILAALILGALAAVVGVGAALVVARQIVNPIIRLTDAAVELGKGNLEVRADVRSRDEIGALANSFNQMAAARQQGEADLGAAQEEIVKTAKLAVIGQWSAGIAHDLRNPLGGIKNASYLLKKGLNSNGSGGSNGSSDSNRADANLRLLDWVEIIDEAVDKSNKIITDLMTYVKDGVFALTETDLDKVLEETVEIMLKSDNVELLRLPNPDLSPVMADGDQLQRVFLNLANNAREAMPGGGKLTI
ncbi:MAG: HAMP domain-containing protein, partial [Dehalococcoidia bacterium]